MLKKKWFKIMVSINIVCVGKIKEKYLKDALEEYSKRLSKYCNLTIIEIQDEKIPLKINDNTIHDTKVKECDKILSCLKKDSFVISLDLKGKQLASEEFSMKLEDIQVRGYSSITFIIGGTLGLTSKIASFKAK